MKKLLKKFNDWKVLGTKLEPSEDWDFWNAKPKGVPVYHHQAGIFSLWVGTWKARLAFLFTGKLWVRMAPPFAEGLQLNAGNGGHPIINRGPANAGELCGVVWDREMSGQSGGGSTGLTFKMVPKHASHCVDLEGKKIPLQGPMKPVSYVDSLGLSKWAFMPGLTILVTNHPGKWIVDKDRNIWKVGKHKK